MYLSSKSEGNKFLFSHDFAIFFFLFSRSFETRHLLAIASTRTRPRIARIRIACKWTAAVYRFIGGGGRNVRFRFSRALRPIDSEKLGISSGPLSSVRPFYVNASSVILEFQERRKDSVTPLIFTRDNFPISRPVHPILFEANRLPLQLASIALRSQLNFPRNRTREYDTINDKRKLALILAERT